MKQNTSSTTSALNLGVCFNPAPLLRPNVGYMPCLLLSVKALPRQWDALETDILQPLRSRILTSISPFLIYLLMVSIVILYLVLLWTSHLPPPCRALACHMTIISTSYISTPAWSLVYHVCCYRLNCCCFPDLTCPHQRSLLCIMCVVIGSTVAASLISHVHTSVVSCVSCVLLSAQLLLLP